MLQHQQQQMINWRDGLMKKVSPRRRKQRSTTSALSVLTSTKPAGVAERIHCQQANGHAEIRRKTEIKTKVHQSGSSGRKTADQTRVESEVSVSCAGVVTGIEIKTRSPGDKLGDQGDSEQGWPCIWTGSEPV